MKQRQGFPRNIANQLSRAAMLFVPVLLMQCNYKGNVSGIHWFLDMHDNLAVESQEEDYTTLSAVKDGWAKSMDNSESWGGPGSAVRVPPEGSVPRNFEPYPYEATDFAGAAVGLTNPLPRTRAILARGQKEYNTYCAVCHGNTGLGDGPVTPRLSAVPSLMTDKIKGWKDGEIFHIVTMGRARMLPFSAQIPAEDRWAIIHYVRLLQANHKQTNGGAN